MAGPGQTADNAVLSVNSNAGRYSKFIVGLAGVVLTGIFAGWGSKAGITADVVAALVYIVPNAQKVLTSANPTQPPSA